MREGRCRQRDAAVFARLSATPLYNALLRTTCVATMLEGGHARERAAAVGEGDGELPHAAGRATPRKSSSTLVRVDQRHDGASRADRHREAEPRVAAARRIFSARSMRR